RRRHTRFSRDWSSDVCSSDLVADAEVDGGGLVEAALGEEDPAGLGLRGGGELLRVPLGGDLVGLDQADALAALVGGVVPALLVRSEERRVGKEWSSGSSERRA